jgi:hypothetical protein
MSLCFDLRTAERNLIKFSIDIMPLGYGLDGRVSNLGRGKIYLFSTSSRSALGPTQPPIQWVPGAISPGVKRPGREADHSFTSGAEIKNDGAIPPLPHTSSWLTGNFTFYYVIGSCVKLETFLVSLGVGETEAQSDIGF